MPASQTELRANWSIPAGSTRLVGGRALRYAMVSFERTKISGTDRSATLSKSTQRSDLPSIEEIRIAVIGLGYVGLPLAAYLARRFPVVGFDIDSRRVAQLRRGVDETGEVTDEEMRLAVG